MTTMYEALAALSHKLDELARGWGMTYCVKGAVVLERGTLWLKKREKGWSFMWEETGLPMTPLTSASTEARLDGVHALPDLRRELERTHDRRKGDVEEAHELMDKLLREHVEREP